MFDIGFGEMILLAAIALIAIGPKQLPEVARALGKLLGEVKKTMGEVTSTVANAREETDRAIRKVTSDLTDITDDINKQVAHGLNVNPEAKPIAILPDHPGDPPWVDPDQPTPPAVATATPATIPTTVRPASSIGATTEIPATPKLEKPDGEKT